MSAIKLLILGVLSGKGPMHGYEIRQELESWNAEQWANIAYGSIYFALKSMAKDNLIKVVNEDQPEKIVYEITASGKEKFLDLLRKYWQEIKPIIDPFQVALTFMNYLPKDELLILLEYRADSLRLMIKSMNQLTPIRMKETKAPEHIAENLKLYQAHLQAEIDWIKEAIEKVKAGKLP